LLNITGGSIGRAAYVLEDISKANINQHVCIIRPVLLNSNFIHKFVVSPHFQNTILDSTTGAGREGLPKNNLEKFLVVIPPLSEQSEIVRRVEKLLGYCEELERELELAAGFASMLKQSLLRDVFDRDSVTKGTVELSRKPEKHTATPIIFGWTDKNRYAAAVFLALVHKHGSIDINTGEGVFNRLASPGHLRAGLTTPDKNRFNSIEKNFDDYFNTVKIKETVFWRYLLSNLVSRQFLREGNGKFFKGAKFNEASCEFPLSAVEELVEFGWIAYQATSDQHDEPSRQKVRTKQNSQFAYS